MKNLVKVLVFLFMFLCTTTLRASTTYSLKVNNTLYNLESPLIQKNDMLYITADELAEITFSTLTEHKGTYTLSIQGKWYTEAVLWAYQNGIVAGTSDTTFAPQSNITREQIVAIFSRYTAKFAPDKAKAAAELTAFADSASVSDWAVNDMKWAVAQKIISGSENAGKFYLLPQDNASRAQVATILMQYCAL